MAINPVQTFQQVVSLELGAEKKVERSYAQANKLAGIFDTCIWGQAATSDDSIPAKEAHELCDELRSIRGVYIYDSKKLKTTGQKVSHFFKRFFTVIFRKYVDVSKYSEITPVLERYVTEQRGPQKSDQPGTILRIGQAIGIVRPEGPSVEELQATIEAQKGAIARQNDSSREKDAQLQRMEEKVRQAQENLNEARRQIASLDEEKKRLQGQLEEKRSPEVPGGGEAAQQAIERIAELERQLEESSKALRQMEAEKTKPKARELETPLGEIQPAEAAGEQSAQILQLREQLLQAQQELSRNQSRIQELTQQLATRPQERESAAIPHRDEAAKQIRELERRHQEEIKTLCLQSRKAARKHIEAVLEFTKKNYSEITELPRRKEPGTIYFEEITTDQGLPFVRVYQGAGRPKEHDPRKDFTLFSGLTTSYKNVCWVVQ